MRLTKKCPCSDWYRGWGFGGYHHVGNLCKVIDGQTYIWTGRCQGRHGQRWHNRSRTEFALVYGKIHILSQKGCGLPDERDVFEAIAKINKAYPLTSI
jgi:hypothetical protein